MEFNQDLTGYIEERDKLRRLKAEVEFKIKELNNRVKPILLKFPSHKIESVLGAWSIEVSEYKTLNRDALIANLLVRGVSAEIAREAIEAASSVTKSEKVVWRPTRVRDDS